jgi:hypothetical protein
MEHANEASLTSGLDLHSFLLATPDILQVVKPALQKTVY